MLNTVGNSFIVEKIHFMELPPYHDQFLRPYVPQMHGNFVEQVYANMRPGAPITHDTFGRFASTIMSPSASAASPILIPGGWNMRRFRWFARIAMRGIQNIPQYHLISGWCEDWDRSLQQSLNPNMILHITSSMMFREVTMPDGLGGYTTVLRPAFMTHVLQNSSFGAVPMATTQNMARPEDLLRHMAMNAQLGGQMQHMGSITPVDSLHGSVACKSAYSNAIPSEYLANVVRPLVTAMTYDEMGQSTEDMFERAINTSRESSIMADPVLTMFMNSRGDDLAGAQITYGQLANLYPMIDSVTHVTTRGTMQHESSSALAVSHPLAMATGRDANHFQGATETTRIAQVLTNALPALIVQSGMAFMSFRSSNYDAGPTPFKTEIFGSAPLFERSQVENLIPQFIFRLENELMMDLSNQNQSSILIWCDVSYTGDCKIMIEWNGVRDQFIQPTFAGNMFAPVVSDNLNMTVDTARNVNNLVQGSFQYHMGQTQQAMQGFTPVQSPAALNL